MKTILLIYMGTRLYNGKSVQCYHNTENSATLTFSKKLLGYESVGNGVLADNDGNNSWHNSRSGHKEGIEWRRLDDNALDVNEWSATHRAVPPLKPTLYDLQLYKKVNGKWVHSETVIWNAPYSLCRGEKIKREAYKAHFEFYKITKN